RRKRRLGPTVQPGVDGGGVDAGKWLVAGGLYYLAEDVLPLPSGPRRQGRPGRGLAIAGNQPRQCGGGRRVLLRASSAGDGGLILGVEIGRSEFRTKASARPFTHGTYQTVRPCRVTSRCRCGGRGRGMLLITERSPQTVQARAPSFLWMKGG